MDLDSVPTDLKGRLLTQKDGLEWEKAIHRDLKNVQKTPRYCLFPDGPEDVSKAVKWAVRNKIPIAVKGGGNNQAGASSCVDGLVIDLRSINHVEIQDETVRIGGGCLWGEVYEALHKVGRLAVGGGANVVGVGGFLTGGGNSWLSSMFGTGCDQILAATVVLADGRIVQCSSKHYPDLFWAIRGGSSQFGIVVEFVLRTFGVMGDMLAGTWIYPGRDFVKVMQVLDDWLKKRGSQESLVLGLMQDSKDEDGFVIFINPWGIGPKERLDGIFSPFKDVLTPLVDRTFMARSMLELGTAADALLLHGPPRSSCNGAAFTRLWPGMVEQCKNVMLEFIQKFPSFTNTMLMFEMHEIKRVDPAGCSYHVTVPRHSYVVATAGYQDTADDDLAFSFSTKMTDIVRSFQRENEGHDLHLIANYISCSAPLEDVWGKSYPRLQEVKVG